MRVHQTNKSNKGIIYDITTKIVNNLDSEITAGRWGFRAHDAMWYAEKQHVTYKPLAEKILKRYPDTKNILEIGCGTGSLCKHFRDIKSDIVTVTLDGNPESAKSPYVSESHYIVRTDVEYNLIDLDSPDHNTIKFDLIVSFEHFEHIHVDTFDVFMDNIKRHSSPDTVIIATAADWPDGAAHCNIKDKHGWETYLESQDCTLADTSVMPEVTPFNFTASSTIELIFNISKP